MSFSGRTTRGSTKSAHILILSLLAILSISPERKCASDHGELSLMTG
jgi:hypothetical protein